LELLAEVTESSDKNIQAKALSVIEKGFGQLYKRSHSNQMYVDASYALCQAYINGALTDKFLDFILNIDTNTANTIAINNIEQIKKELKKNQHNAYLQAQSILSQMAFNSLIHEFKYFYDSNIIKNQAKLEIYEEQFAKDIKKLQKTTFTNTATIKVNKELIDKNSNNINTNFENIKTINGSPSATVEIKEITK
jgi:hypothetical protein